MKLFVFEGSVDELSEVAKNLGVQSVAAAVEVPNEPEAALKAHSASEGDDPVSVKFARRVLKRLAISEPMQAVLQELYDAGDAWVGIEQLCSASNYTRQQFAGLMGAFGRRVSHTQGYDEETYFFEVEWDHENSGWRYKLPSTVRDALVQEEIVTN